jgi:hypothetical protein
MQGGFLFVLLMLRCVGRDWHIADKPTIPGFVAYWGNNGQKSVQALNG